MREEAGRGGRGAIRLVPVVIAALLAGCAKELPDSARHLVFDESDFAAPITMALPSEDSRDFLKMACTSEFGSLTPIPPATIRWMNPHVLSFMAQKGFVEIDDAVIHGKYGNQDAKFLFYTGRLRGDPNMKAVDQQYVWTIGKRRLKKISYANRYEAAPLGTPLEMVGITFDYAIEWNVPELADPGKAYEGKATAYLDPNDGEWKLEQLTLPDRGEEEFKKALAARFPAYDETSRGNDGCVAYKDIIEAQQAHAERKRVANEVTEFVEKFTFEVPNELVRSRMDRVDVTLTDVGLVVDEAVSHFFGPPSHQKSEFPFSRIERPYVPAGIADGRLFVGKRFGVEAQDSHQRIIDTVNTEFEGWKVRNAQLIADCPKSRTWGCMDD